MSVLTTNDLNKSFGGQHALQDFSVSLQPGSVTTILGPNGSGKTTFIKSILGILQPDSGSVCIDGQALSLPYGKETRRKFLYIPDDPVVMEYLSGRENIEYMCALYGCKMTKQQIGQVLEKYGLGGSGDKMVKNYSRGMRQRLCLSYMEIYSPDILILDEPTNGLDLMAIQHISRFLRSIAAAGKTVLIATHDMSFCKSVSDRVIMIRSGRCLTQESMAECEARYGSIENAVECLLLGQLEESAA